MGREARTLYRKIWDDHLVAGLSAGSALLYIDRHLIHEVSSPQAFEALRDAGRLVRRPDATLAVPDHNVPTTGRGEVVKDPDSALQLDLLRDNCAAFGIEHIPLDDPRQGIVHIVGPEQGLTLPGMTIVCGDSHTSTHGAFGALAFGIGTSEVEHVLAAQTLVVKKAGTMRVTIDGRLPAGVTAKDLILAVIARIGTDGAGGLALEFAGEAVRALSMEGRMTLCNMSVEAGARAGLIAPDEVTFEYLRGRPRAPKAGQWQAALAHWRGLASDAGARFEKEISLDAAIVPPLVTWGTSPEDVVPITGRVPDPADLDDAEKRRSAARALAYMGLAPGTAMTDIAIDRVFIGSCTNSRIEDLRQAAGVIRGRRVAKNVRQALVVPGSGLVKHQAEEEGLDRIFIAAGFEWRQPGCSMCVALNADKVPAGERCASTSNRNYTGRQGPGARTHLMSPGMAASAALAGRLADVRRFAPEN